MGIKVHAKIITVKALFNMQITIIIIIIIIMRTLLGVPRTIGEKRQMERIVTGKTA